MSLTPYCPLCHCPVEVDEETGLITFCLGCEGGIGYVPNYCGDEDYD